ncbi:elongation factor P [bacterium BMS3Abin01]|nr:elongation factor P [bacterium BMS3Abin01]HDZ60009.1 elongation factor P [Actinomycetota bacterium]
MVSTNDFKNGMAIEVDGKIYSIVGFQHVKPGKGGAFVRTRLKNLQTGNVLDKTFRAGEKFRKVHTASKKMLFMYATPDEVVLMDNDTYEQESLSPELAGDALKFIQDNMEVELALIDGEPTQILPPIFVILEVKETEPGVRGDTASGGGLKPATMDTGAEIKVPLFMNIGDKVKIDTRTGEYVERA